MLLREKSVDIHNWSSSSKTKGTGEQSHRIPSFRYNRWHHFYVGLSLLTLSTVLSGFLLVKQQLKALWQTEFDEFRWVVLVEGDPLQSDEVGRFLKQMDEVYAVQFVSNDDAFLKIAKNPLFSEDLKNIEITDLPSSWEIQWRPDDDVGPEQLQESLKELLLFPGVVDIAFDQDKWDQIKMIKKSWLQLRVVMALTLLLLIGLALFFLGRYLFFIPLHFIGWNSFAGTLVVDWLCWSVGYLIAHLALGFDFINKPLLALGLIPGLIHAIWKGKGVAP